MRVLDVGCGPGDVSTLAEHLHDDASSTEPIVMWPIVIGAYALKP